MASDIVACAWSFAGSVETSVRGVRAACPERRRICALWVRTQILHALLAQHTVLAIGVCERASVQKTGHGQRLWQQRINRDICPCAGKCVRVRRCVLMRMTCSHVWAVNVGSDATKGNNQADFAEEGAVVWQRGTRSARGGVVAGAS